MNNAEIFSFLSVVMYEFIWKKLNNSINNKSSTT